VRLRKHEGDVHPSPVHALGSGRSPISTELGYIFSTTNDPLYVTRGGAPSKTARIWLQTRKAEGRNIGGMTGNRQVRLSIDAEVLDRDGAVAESPDPERQQLAVDRIPVNLRRRDVDFSPRDPLDNR